jgi:sugar transferase (PEP-CTERM/EpsH1 system associated)
VKLLWVKSGDLLPLDNGGKTRSLNLLKELARNHEVSLFLFYGAHANDQHGELKKYFSSVVTVPLDFSKKRGVGEALEYAAHLFSVWPHSVAKYCRPQVSARLKEVLKERPFDLLVCDFLHAAKAIPWEWPVPKLLFTHNVEELIWRRSYEVAINPIWKAVCWREYRRMREMEQKYVGLADQVLTVSENDSKYFSFYTNPEKITVVPTGVDIDYFHPMLRPEKATSMVFTGSMDWLPNEDAILYLSESILPKIRVQEPGAAVWVVGRSPSQKLRDVGAKKVGIHVTGTVEDVRPYIAESQVYIVPLRIGGGTRIKIFEAMSMGKAVVSTSVGAEGLPVEHTKNIILADSPEEFASQVVRLLRDQRAREAIGRAARKLVEENYSWASVARSFEGVLHRAMEARIRCSSAR